MPITPAVPRLNAPEPVPLPTYLGERADVDMRLKREMVATRRDVREREYRQYEDQWMKNAIKDKDFLDRVKGLEKTSDSEVEKSFYASRKRMATSAVHEKNIVSEKTKIDSDSYKDGSNPMDIYNRYSNLSRVAAGLGFSDVSASLLLEANQTVRRMKDYARSLEAEARARERDEADAWLGDVSGRLQDSIYGAGDVVPEQSFGPMSTPQGALIPEPSAEEGFLFVPPR